MTCLEKWLVSYAKNPVLAYLKFNSHNEGVLSRFCISRFWMILAILSLGSAMAQAPMAPPRPVCTKFGAEIGACRWNPVNGLGPGTSVVLSDGTGPRAQSKLYFREALARLSATYGFTITHPSRLNDITEKELSGAKVLILSNGDGTIGGSIPTEAIQARVENFVMQRGWGILAVHAACAFVDTWPFLQDVCVQQYNHQTPSGTKAAVYVENRTVDGQGHGRQNPFTSFLLEGLPDTVKGLADQWFTWRGNPRTTHQFNRESKNKIMLLALDEQSFSSAPPLYPDEHYVAWTHTLGPADGIAFHFSPGEANVYTQGTRAYGDTLLWRMLRYAAKDWCQIGQPGCDQVTGLKAAHAAGQQRIVSKAGMLFISGGPSGIQSVTVFDMDGRRIPAAQGAGAGEWVVAGLKSGLYFVQFKVEGVTRMLRVAHTR